MKVTVRLVIDVDAREWWNTNGYSDYMTEAEIKKDIHAYVSDNAALPMLEEANATWEWK